ncbi:MAG: two-component regulator propeller domain-containing protein [Ferruginibacter sp.]
MTKQIYKLQLSGWYCYRSIILVVLILSGQKNFCQEFNFRHVTTSDGLSNGVIRGITQDKYGYIWIATVSGLSRYNGYNVKVFLHAAKDTFSIPENNVTGILNDSSNKLWFVFSNGLYRYDFETNHFILQQSTKDLHIRKIVQGNRDSLWLATATGAAIFNTKTAQVNFPFKRLKNNSAALLGKPVIDFFFQSAKGIYFIVDTGIVLYRPQLNEVELLPIKNLPGQIEKIAVDKDGNIWLSYGANGSKLIFISHDYNTLKEYPGLTNKISNNHIYGFFIDRQQRAWISTSEQGLGRFDTTTNRFIFYGYNALQPQSLSSSNVTNIFQDKQDFIWVGTEGYGVNYFQPDNDLFHTLPPILKNDIVLSGGWSRAVAEDEHKNLYLGGVNGVSHYNKETGNYSFLQNNKENPARIYSNSVRSLLYDDHHLLWIGTALGLNRFHPATGQVEFFTAKDSVPASFYKVIIQDKNKNIWIGCRDGLFRYDYKSNAFYNFKNDIIFKTLRTKNVQSIFRDSKERLWFGTYRDGIFFYDPNKKTVSQVNPPKAFNKNVRSFAEDKAGNIWIAGVDGLSMINNATGKFTFYNEEQGFTINTSSLLMDKHDRLWIGTGKGLYELDSARRSFTMFSIKDGLPALEVNEQEAFKTSDGNFIYPMLKGFLYFNPDDYKVFNQPVDVYISSVKVFNKELAFGNNAENLKSLSLKYDQNFFSFELTGFNYANAGQTRYAYKLEPFDKEWTYTNERTGNYTNVPGGDYVLHYKSSSNETWNQPGKTLQIHISSVFYKTIWFKILFVWILLSLFYIIYKYRIKQNENIFALKSKTQILEKEKAVVQYESLKQQLNPHFLFNSLTSLRSLIRINKESAADFLDNLSMNYRYILKSTESELVPLSDEIKFVQTYIDLQQTRFGKGLQVNIDVPEDIFHKKIVPVILQNLIENAIKHNLIDAVCPLEIKISSSDNYLIVQNNLQEKEFVETSNKYGLKNLESLYKYLDDRSLIIKKEEHLFIVKIPLI